MDSFKLLERVMCLTIVNPVQLSLVSKSLGLNASHIGNIESKKFKYTLTLTARGWFVLCDRRVNPSLCFVWRECLKLSDCVPNTPTKISEKCNRAAVMPMPEIELSRSTEDV